MPNIQRGEYDMRTNFIPLTEIEKKKLIEYMFDNLNVASTDNGNYGYIVCGYDYEKYTCQYSNEEMAEITVLIVNIIDEMRHAKANGFDKLAFINIINQPNYDNVYKTIDSFKKIASKQMLDCIWMFMCLVPNKNPFKVCITEFIIIQGISWLYLQLLKRDDYDSCKELAIDLLNLFLSATGERYNFTA